MVLCLEFGWTETLGNTWSAGGIKRHVWSGFTRREGVGRPEGPAQHQADRQRELSTGGEDRKDQAALGHGPGAGGGHGGQQDVW